MKVIFFFLILIILFLLPSCTQTPENVLKDYIQAHNSHDVEKELSFYNDNITFEIKNTWIKKGKDKMRELAEWDSTLNSHLKYEIISSKQDTITCRVIERNGWFSAAGIDEVVHDSTIFVIQNDKIKSIYASSNNDEIKKIVDVISSIYQWSYSTGDSTIYELIKEGEFVYSPEAAIKWLQLFERWKSKGS